MPSKVLTDKNFAGEILDVLKEKRGDFGGLVFTTGALREELYAKGISYTDQELVSAINILIHTSKIKLTLLCFENSILGVEFNYPV